MDQSCVSVAELCNGHASLAVVSQTENGIGYWATMGMRLRGVDPLLGSYRLVSGTSGTAGSVRIAVVERPPANVVHVLG